MLRPASAGDAAAIGQVVVASWRSTYPGMIPRAYLDAMDASKLAGPWSRRLADPAFAGLTFVVESAGEVVGFATGGPERSMTVKDGGELYAIYLVREAQGRGWGRALVARVADALLGRGFRSMVVWAVRDNHAARGFYERLGGVYMRERLLDLGAGVGVVEVGYSWPDMRGPLARGRPPPRGAAGDTPMERRVAH